MGVAGVTPHTSHRAEGDSPAFPDLVPRDRACLGHEPTQDHPSCSNQLLSSADKPRTPRVHLASPRVLVCPTPHCSAAFPAHWRPAMPATPPLMPETWDHSCPSLSSTPCKFSPESVHLSLPGSGHCPSLLDDHHGLRPFSTKALAGGGSHPAMPVPHPPLAPAALSIFLSSSRHTGLLGSPETDVKYSWLSIHQPTEINCPSGRHFKSPSCEPRARYSCLQTAAAARPRVLDGPVGRSPAGSGTMDARPLSEHLLCAPLFHP